MSSEVAYLDSYEMVLWISEKLHRSGGRARIKAVFIMNSIIFNFGFVLLFHEELNPFRIRAC